MATIVKGPFSASTTSGPVTSLGVVVTGGVTSGNMIAVIVRQAEVSAGTAAGRTVAVTDTLGNTYTLAIASDNVSGDKNDVRIFYAKNIGGGTNTVTAAFSGSGSTGRAEVVAWEVNGLDATAPLEDTSKGTGTSSAPSAGSVDMAGGGFAVAAMHSENGYRTAGAGSGWTGTNGAAIWAVAYYETRLPGTAGTYTGDFTLSSSDNWTAAVAAFKDSAGGGGSATGAAAHYYRQL